MMANSSPSVGALFVAASLATQAAIELLSPWVAKRARFALVPWLAVLFLTSVGLHVVVIGDRVWLPGRIKPLRGVKSVVQFVRHAPHPTDRHGKLCAVRSSRGDVLMRTEDPAELALFIGVPLVVESV